MTTRLLVATMLVLLLCTSASPAREWTDASGKFSVEAELVEVRDGKVRLKMANDKVIAVPIAKLSAADRKYLAGLQLEKPAAAGLAASVPATRLTQKPTELAHDDGKPAGKKSFPRGHAVAFESPGGTWYLNSVRIHGARYGTSRPPAEDFHVWLCDKDFNKIADFPFPYARFAYGRSGWVTLKTPPTKVPAEFVICVGFNATSRKGVYVSHDAEGQSLVGLAGKPAGRFTGGNWLIRASVGQGSP